MATRDEVTDVIKFVIVWMITTAIAIAICLLWVRTSYPIEEDTNTNVNPPYAPNSEIDRNCQMFFTEILCSEQ